MSSVYDEFNKHYTEAKMSFDNNQFDSFANSMRKVAEVVAGFYIEHYKLIEKYEELRQEKNYKEYNGVKNLLCSIYTLRRKISRFSDDFQRSLLVFLTLARKYGNMGSHSGAELERWEVEFLLRYFEKEILNQLMSDIDKKSNKKTSFRNVTKKYDGHIVLIYSMAAEKYASTREDLPKAPIYCNTDNQDAWEKYVVEVDNNGWASFKASNGNYLSVDLDEDEDYPPIRAIAPQSLGWEKFKIYRYDGHYALKAGCNDKWVSCRIDWDNSPLYATCDNVDWWEEFDIKEV